MFAFVIAFLCCCLSDSCTSEKQSRLSQYPLMATFLVALLLLSSLLMLMLVKIFIRKKKNLVPVAGGSWPLLGHLPLLRVPKPAHKVLDKLGDQYGPIFMINIGIKRTVVVNNWEIARECLTVHDRVLASRPLSVSSKILGYDDVMIGFCPYGDYWRQIRKLVILELLSNQRLEMFKDVRESMISMACRELYQLWDAKKDDSNRVPVVMKTWIGEVTLNMIFRIVFGKTLGFTSCQGLEDSTEEWKLCLKEFFELAGKFVIADALPFLRWLDIGNDEKAMKKLDHHLVEWLKEHKEEKRVSNGAKGNGDFMHVMLSLFEKPENVPDGKDADTIIKATCLGMILAGSDTTTVTLSWALALLVNHPHIMKKAQQEIDDEVGKDRLVSEPDTKNFVYLDAIIKETLRLYPAVPLSIPHLSMEDCTVAGYHIPAGTTVLFHVSKIQRDPRVWTEANEFRPERFLTEHKDKYLKGQNFELIPFGSGRRMCAGVNFSLVVLRLTLAALIHAFDFESSSPIDMTEQPSFTNYMASNLDLLLTPRLNCTAY